MTFEESLQRIKDDPDVDWLDVSFTWRRAKDPFKWGEESWHATAGGEIDGEEWYSGEIGGSTAEDAMIAAVTPQEVPA